MKQFGSQYIVILKQLALIMLLFTLSRLSFYIFNLDFYSNIDYTSIVMAFVYGLQFDMSAVLYANALLILLSLFPSPFIKNNKYQSVLKFLFVMVNALALMTNLIDMEYVQFTGKRSDIYSIFIPSDIFRQAPQLLKNYWYITVLILLLFAFLFMFFPAHRKTKYPLSPGIAILLTIMTLTLLIIGIRGGLGGYPLMPIHAYKSGVSQNLGLLSLNTPFNIIHSLDDERLKEFEFMEDEKVKEYLAPTYIESSDNEAEDKANVVLIILESFGSSSVGYFNQVKGSTPFLDSLAEKGSAFRNAYANGRTSAEAIPSILSGVPSLFNGFISNSLFTSNKIYSPCQTLSKQGYNSAFYHGGDNGTMFFDSWVKKMGMSYYGLNEYRGKEEDFDGQWGIFDEPYLQYFAEELEGKKPPFFSVMFTLSSHHPYVSPEKMKDQFLEIKDPVSRSIRYSDYALSQFFNRAAKMEWYDNTLFIITADHVLSGTNPKNSILDLYQIPMILYHPSKELDIDSLQIVEQLDIPVSIADFLGVDSGPFPALGRSFFSKQAEEVQDAIFYQEPFWYLVKRDHFLRFNGQNEFIAFDKKQKEINFSSIDPEEIQYLKAYIQYYTDAMIHNRFMER